MQNKTCKYILALDPSGNFNEGNGKTGWALFSVEFKRIIKFGQLEAGLFRTKEDYWKSHIDLINNFYGEFPGLHVVMEDYLLYANKAQAQTNSRMETPKLIGVIQYHCYFKNLPIEMQTASAVKTRWKEDILVHKGYITEEIHYRKNRFTHKEEPYTVYQLNGYTVSDHIRDAVKHGVHYMTFKV